MRKLLTVVIVLLVLVAVAVMVGLVMIDRLAAAAIERGGTFALGVPTTLEEADVGIASRQLDLRTLTVGNPEGFDAPHFLQLDAGGMAVDLASLRADVVTVPRLNLRGLDMHLQKRGGEANYDVILENLRRFEDADAAPPDAGKRFIISDLVIDDVVVHVDLLPVGGLLTRLNVPIDRIELSDVGSETDRGLLIAELADVIIKAVLATVTDKAGEVLPPSILGDLEQQLAQLRGLDQLGITLSSDLGARLEEAARIIEGAQDAGDAARTIGEGISDLLNRGGNDE